MAKRKLPRIPLRGRYWQKLKNYTIRVRLDPDTYSALTKESIRTGTTVSDLIRRAIVRDVMDKSVVEREFLAIDDGQLDKWELQEDGE